MARQAGGPITGRGNFRYTSYFSQYVQAVTEAQKKAAQRTADWAYLQARSLVPVDTGNLRDSIDYEIRQTEASFAVVIFAGAEYALYVELGTSRMQAQPYLRPVLDRIGEVHRRFLAEEVARINLRKVA